MGKGTAGSRGSSYLPMPFPDFQSDNPSHDSWSRAARMSLYEVFARMMPPHAQNAWGVKRNGECTISDALQRPRFPPRDSRGRERGRFRRCARAARATQPANPAHGSAIRGPGVCGSFPDRPIKVGDGGISFTPSPASSPPCREEPARHHGRRRITPHA
jgi:hypothetical protein